MKNITFLIIENERSERELLERNIRVLGYTEIVSFDCLTAAYSWLKEKRTVDILICDLDLASASLVFLKKISEKYQVGGVALFSRVNTELRHSVARIVELLGMRYLGDLKESILKSSIKQMIVDYKVHCSSNLTPLSLDEEDSFEINYSPSVDDLKVAISNDEFVGFFQPKYFLNSMSISGAEVLLRWNHPVHGVLKPDCFIDALIKNKLLDEVFLSIFKQGLDLQKDFLAKNKFPLALAYNLDALQLNSTKLVRTLIDIVRQSEVNPCLITFEITEKNITSNTASFLKNLVRLRVLGFELAIDDFGSAYSSMSRLCDFPFTQIKLDKNFTQRVSKEKKYKLTLMNILSLANMLNMSLVVEGIETDEHLQTMRNLGCLEAQGYYFAKPINYKDFIRKINIGKFNLSDKNYIKYSAENRNDVVFY